MDGFKPRVLHTVPLLFRERPNTNGYFAKFGPDADGFESFISWAVLAGLRRSLERERPFETAGLLLGRPMQDHAGPYVVITGFVMAEHSELDASPSYVNFPAKSQETVWDRALERYPIVDKVGWWHTHPKYSPVFSSVDEREQTRWSEPYHIGIVASGLPGHTIFGVYRGPNVRLLHPDPYTQQMLLQKATLEKPRTDQNSKPQVIYVNSGSRSFDRALFLLLGSILASIIYGFIFLWAQNLKLTQGLTRLQDDVFQTQAVVITETPESITPIPPWVPTRPPLPTVIPEEIERHGLIH